MLDAVQRLPRGPVRSAAFALYQARYSKSVRKEVQHALQEAEKRASIGRKMEEKPA